MYYTREEFVSTPSAFRFAVNPLDINIIKIQERLIGRMKDEVPVNGCFKTIVEEYTSENPLREFGRMTIVVREGMRENGYDVVMTVYSKDGLFFTSSIIYHGNWEQVCKFVGSTPSSAVFKWDFFSSCKAHALWTNHCITNFVKCIEWDAIPKIGSTWMNFFYGRTGNKEFDTLVFHTLEALYPDTVIMSRDIPTDSEQRILMLTSLLRTDSVDVKVLPVIAEFTSIPLYNEIVIYLSANENQQLIITWDHEADWDIVANSLLPMIYQILKMQNNMVRIEEKDDKYYIYGITELEGCYGYSWGENLLYVRDNEYGEYLVNKVTGKYRKFAEPGKLVGFSDEEIDFEAIDKLEHSSNAHSRSVQYAGINRWTDCENGLIALSWMLYPDGRYFADADGYGMEDNDEVKVYCVIDENLQVVRPFAPVEDVPLLLEQLSRK